MNDSTDREDTDDGGFCPSGKRAYDSKAQAKTTVKRARKTGKRFYPYVCPHCGQWHLTSTKPREQRLGE